MNTKKKIIVLIFIAVIAIAFGLSKKNAVSPDLSSVTPTVLGNTGDLVSFSVAAGAPVSGNMTITGSVQNAYFFEANILVKVLDANQNVLVDTYGTATTDWMTTAPVSFTTNIDFTNLPSGPGYIMLENDNPSGDPNLVKQILIPVIIN